MDQIQNVHIDGRPMDQKEIFRGLKMSVLATFFGMMWFAVASGVPTTMLMECLTGSGVMIGLVVTIQQLAMVMQIPSAYVFEQIPRRKKIWAISAIISRALWFIPAIAPLLMRDMPAATGAVILVGVGASACFSQIQFPIWQNWMADLIPEKMSGRFWGIRQSILTFSFLLATWLSGFVLDLFSDPRQEGGVYAGFSIVFSAAALFGICDILIHIKVPEPRHGVYKRDQDILERVLTPLKITDFRWMTLSYAAWYFAIGLVGSFGIVYLQREFNVSYTQLSLLAVASSIGPVMMGLLNGFIIDRVGARTFGSILFGVVPLLSFSWFFISYGQIDFAIPLLGNFSLSQPVFLFLIVNLVAGALSSGIILCQLHMINVLSPKNGRGMAIAVHWSIIGLMSAAGPFTGGLIMDIFTKHPFFIWKLPGGVPFSFYHLLVLLYILTICFLSVPMMLKVKVRAGEMPLREALGSIRVGNPLRAISIVFNIYQTAFDFSDKANRKKRT